MAMEQRISLVTLGVTDREDLLRATYDAFNARDIDAVLLQMTKDVDWPNAWEGGRVHGHEGVRDYWTRQWAAIDPAVAPVSFTTRPDGRVAAEVRQVARSLNGGPLGEQRVVHVFQFRGDLVVRMDIEELARTD
jgi:ketosteroid isomerase-like protein